MKGKKQIYMRLFRLELIGAGEGLCYNESYSKVNAGKIMEKDFYQKMRIACMAVPPGRVATYGQIALICGAPNHARQVGYGLKRNLAGEDVPAHRIVNGRGELSGACHFEFDDLQMNLLREEGVELVWTGKYWRVDLKKYGWKNPLAEELQNPNP